MASDAATGWAIVLPNDPEMAAAFLSIGAGASAAPLNPAHKKDEFAFYLDDFGTSALVVEGRQSVAGGGSRGRARHPGPVDRVVGLGAGWKLPLRRYRAGRNG